MDDSTDGPDVQFQGPIPHSYNDGHHQQGDNQQQGGPAGAGGNPVRGCREVRRMSDRSANGCDPNIELPRSPLPVPVDDTGDGDSVVMPEESRRHSHHVRLGELQNVAEQDDSGYGHFADDMFSGLDMGNINDNAEESAVVEEIERKVGFGGLGSDTGGIAGMVGLAKASNAPVAMAGVAPVQPAELRGRSSSMIQATKDLINRVRFRKNSQDSTEYVEFGFAADGTPYTGLQFFACKCRQVAQYLVPDVSYRANAYLIVLFLLVIAVVAEDHNQPERLFKLYICTVLLEFGCSMLDRVVHKLIDLLFVSRFDIAYQLHSLNGPLGMIITVLIVRNYWQHWLAAEDLVRGWRSYVTAAAVFIICLCAKNWIGRRQYVYLLERRFADKVENLNSMIIILSELASSRPPRSVQLQRTVTRMGDAVEEGSGHSAAAKGLMAAKISTKVRNVFEDLVEASVEEDSDEALTRKELYRKRRSFWQSAARLSQTAGVMKVITYNGVVTLRSQDQARQFGQKLYRHLSKGGKVVVNSELIRKLFEERREAVAGDQAERAEHEHAIASITSQQASSNIFDPHGEERKELWSVAAGLFDPFGLGRVSEEFCVEAVVNIYKEQRFTAASINDFGELHQSLRLGIDIIYWIIMLFVLQALFGFDITAYLLPFVTLLISFSFAIAPLVGNVFLCFAFVFFMAPYDIGHRVQLGLFNIYTPPIIGNVKSITLLYTIIATSKSETVKVPNHTLFTERIYNMTETTGAVHEFVISFNTFGGDHTNMDKINLFFQRLKLYTLRESKEWKTFLVTVSATNATENFVEFKVFVVHREGWSCFQAVNAAKIEYYATIKRLREELGLGFVRAAQRVVLVPEQQAEDTGDTGGNGSYTYGDADHSGSYDTGLRVRTAAPGGSYDAYASNGDAPGGKQRGRSSANADQVTPGTSPVAREGKKEA